MTTGLWNKDREYQFFHDALKGKIEPEELFYVSENGHYYAYWPASYKGKKNPLPGRTLMIRAYTEEYALKIMQHYAEEKGLYAVRRPACREVGLIPRSSAVIALCTHPESNPEPEQIKAVVEVKMSISWNWAYKNGNIMCIGDYRKHSGSPGLLRSDSMLKAIAKGINIRTSGPEAATIPFVVLGNTPVTSRYYNRVDHLRRAGIIQGFWSLNPEPLDESEKDIKSTPGKGYYRFDSMEEFYGAMDNLLDSGLTFFSGMRSRKELGEMISMSAKQKGHSRQADSFLKLLYSD